jgi:hypothetical protein
MAEPAAPNSTQAPVPKPAVAPAPKIEMVHVGEIQVSDNARTCWVIKAPESHTLKDAMHPSYAIRGVVKIKPLDEITILHKGGAFWLRYLVMWTDIEANGFAYRIIDGYDWEGGKKIEVSSDLVTPSIEGAFVSETGDAWAVRLGTQILRGGFKSKEQAGRWITDKQAALKSGSKPS